jgi:hypothetical protein
MPVYKFLSCKYGLKAVRERRLKISEMRFLNDPFELTPFDVSDPEIRRAVIATRNEIGRGSGLLCFSRQWHNPVLWAHYAESHRGLCLGFDVPNEVTQHITYVNVPIQLERLNFETANRMLFTKYDHWRYEDEVRIGATLKEKTGSYYFYAFDDRLRLSEVIVGAASPVSERKILQALGTYQDTVRILKARLAYMRSRWSKMRTALAVTHGETATE